MLTINTSLEIVSPLIGSSFEGVSINIQPTLIASNGGGGGVVNHSQLNLDDGTNPHGTTKYDVGLGDVDNTTDLNKPISNATANALNDKVDKVGGKGLSDENYTDAEKQKLALIQDEATANETDAFLLARANHTGTQSSTTVTHTAQELDVDFLGLVISRNIKSYYINLTEDSIIATFTLPPQNETDVYSLAITTSTGVETFSFPAGWFIYGEFDPTKRNKISIEISNFPILGTVVDVFINQPND